MLHVETPVMSIAYLCHDAPELNMRAVRPQQRRTKTLTQRYVAQCCVDVVIQNCIRR